MNHKKRHIILILIGLIFSFQANGQTKKYIKVHEISGTEIIRDVDIAMDFFVITKETRNLKDKKIVAIDFSGAELWELRKERDKTGPVITSSTSNSFGVIDFRNRAFSDEEFPVYEEKFQLFNSAGVMFDTVQSFNQFGIHFEKDNTFYGKKDNSGFELRMLNSDLSFLMSDSENIKYQSFGESLFLFLTYYSERQGKPGFKRVIKNHEKELMILRDSIQTWTNELEKIKPKTKQEYNAKQKSEKDLRIKVLNEREAIAIDQRKKRNEFQIKDIWKSELFLIDLLKNDTLINVQLPLEQPNRKIVGYRGYSSPLIIEEVPAAISTSFLATKVKNIDNQESVYIFDRNGNKLHDVSSSDFNYVHTMKIVDDSLLFTMSGGGKFDVIDLTSGEFIWRKKLNSYNRYRLLEKQDFLRSDMVILYAREKLANDEIEESVKSFDLKNGELKSIFDLSDVKGDRDRFYEIPNGFILYKRALNSENEVNYSVEIFKMK